MTIYHVAALSVAAAIGVPVAGPWLESQMLPVVIAKVVKQERRGEQVAFFVEGERLRPYCQYEGVVARVESPGMSQRMAEVETPTGRKISRPPGMQSMGAWTVPKPPNTDAASMMPGTLVTFFLRYQCHFLWDTMALVGPVKVE